MSKKYVMVETISSFKMHYAIPLDELKDNAGVVLNEKAAVEHAKDLIENNQAIEHAQTFIGEQFLETKVSDQDQVISAFDLLNPLATGWSIDKKLSLINKWKES